MYKEKLDIAKFKRFMRAYLKKIRLGGEITLLDRSTPIARIVAHKPPDDTLNLIPPSQSGPAFKKSRGQQSR